MTISRLTLSPLLAAALAGFTAVPAGAITFEENVWPILESKCLECHCDKKEKGDLNLELHKIQKHIGGGEVIQPGKSNSSHFIKVIESDDPDVKMPPKGSRLSDMEIQILRLWITRGAEVPKPPDPAAAPEPLAGTWTNKDGKEIEATLLSVEGEMAVLELKNGKTTRYPIAKLSEESQAKVKEFAEGGKE